MKATPINSLLPLMIVAAAAIAPAQNVRAAGVGYEQHVLFDNAAASGGYYHSEVSVVAPSTMEAADGRVPAVADRFVSPPNALRLAWRSAPGGDWRLVLRDPGRDWRSYELAGDTLAFWCYADTEITAANSPRVQLADGAGVWTAAVTLVQGEERLPAGRWVRVKLPADAFAGETKNTAERNFRLRDAVTVVFAQGLDDDQPHTLWLDDFMVVPGDEADTAAPPAPTGVATRAWERHVELTWAAPTAADVLAYRIYRAEGEGPFVPVATQRHAWTRYQDFLGAPPRTARYRVSAVDLAGNESPLSGPTASVTTRPMNDDELMAMTQEACFRYYWEAGHPQAGMAPEILPGDEHLIATGGNGFGIMALLVATERGFVPRAAGVARMLRIVRFLAAADRYHGVWPHFLDGRTGKTRAFFGKFDNGGDLVETSFVIQGLLAARQYFAGDTPEEREIRATATRLWEEVEWDWYRQPGQEVLTWHWSPDHGFHINHPLVGWNETLITYLLAIASPTHPVPAELWHRGWAGRAPRQVAYRQGWGRTTDGDHYTNGKSYHGIKLEVGVGNGGELFFTHFSFMGFDPRGRRDAYTNYFANNRAIALINRAYCMENPRGFVGYGPDTWGRSAGVNSGGAKPLPRDDNGTINVMAALSSMPYTPDESLAALRHFYRDLGDRIWGTFGFHDGFNETQNWFDEDYMALNQAPIVVMIENHRTGLVWKNFMANPEIAPALAAIGFRPDPSLAPGR